MRASAFCWPRSVLSAWGEPARPGFPPEGETGKGAFRFLAAAGHFPTLPMGFGICPGSWRILLFLQRFKAIWIRSPHSIWKWLSACFQPCTVSHFWMTFRSAR
jgi:hypothetical protein